MEGNVSAIAYTVVPTFRGKYPIPSYSGLVFNQRENIKLWILGEILINVWRTQSAGHRTTLVRHQATKQRVVATGGEINLYLIIKAKLSIISKPILFCSTNFSWWLLPVFTNSNCILFGKKKEKPLQVSRRNKILKRANKLVENIYQLQKKALPKGLNFTWP